MLLIALLLGTAGVVAAAVLAPVGHSVTPVLHDPQLGIPVINLKQTALSEKGGMFTYLSHLTNGDPSDGDKVIEAAKLRSPRRACEVR